MKTMPCPMCGESPTTMKAAGVWMTCCLPCTESVGPHADACDTVSESRRAWNEFAVAFKEAQKAEAKP